ncbi:hypothetical protein CBR_g11017 [Chara braunii]|uniref:DNA methylase N-4/N-6 domain-containing protein n=1 Tax=Chara braunii TaxID=69332 RepID=A0A388KQ76_CHABU|nr:hypothetical protein CBR_g11017 [Chara braunii]|eukprot:GBG72083.1 hypothetical protein CBR_g11017 [Chara braunii]
MTKARSSGQARTVSSRGQPACSGGVVQQRQPRQSDVFPVAAGEDDTPHCGEGDDVEVSEDEGEYGEEGEGEEEAGNEEEEEEEDGEAGEEGAEDEGQADEEEEGEDEEGGEEEPMEEEGCWKREFLESRPVRVDFKLFFWAVYITTGLAYLHVKTSDSEQEAATQTPTTTTTTKTAKGAKTQCRKDVISPQTIVESSGGLERGSGTKKAPKWKKMASGPGKGKAGEEGLQVPQGFVPTERAKDLTKTWEELKSLKEKKLSHEFFYLPMSCLKRPPLVNGKRPLEVRELDEDHVQSIMDSMLKHPTGDHLPFVGLMDPGQASRKEEVDLATLRNDHYDIFVLGGNHSREARERLSCMNPDNDDYKCNVCYVYVGLTVDEARQVAHMHNLVAGYHRDYSFIEKLRCQKLKTAVKSILKSDQDLESSESEGGKKSQRGKRLERAAAKEQEIALLHPRVQMQGNKVPMVADDLPSQHWIAMGSMAPEHAVPILLEVIAKQISLKEMEKKFQLVKQVAYVRMAFAVGVGCADFKEAEKQYPLHTKKDMLEKFAGGVRRGQKSIPALDGHIKRALDWKSKERRLQAKEALHAFRSAPLTEPFVDWTEVKHENDAAEVKIINGDMRLLSKLQTEKLPISLTIFNFPYGFAHEGHASDHEPFSKSDVLEVLQNLKDVSSAPFWTVAGFCSVDMLPSIRSAFREVCNAGQELLTWCKPNVTNPGGPRLVSATEYCVLAYYSQTGQREMAHYNFDPTDPRHNFQLFNDVTQKYQHPGGGVLCPYQKPYSLYSWLVNKFSPAGACILDGFSGSGTGAIACVKANWNCLVVEINTKCTKGIATRLLTDIDGTLARETPKSKQKASQGSPTSKLSGDAESAGIELVADGNTGTAAGVAPLVGQGAPVIAGPSCVQKTVSGPFSEPASGPSAEPAEHAAGQAGERPDVANEPAPVPVPKAVPGAGPEAETQPVVTTTPASTDFQQTILSLALSQDSDRTTVGGRRGRKRKGGGEEVSSPPGGVTKANTRSRTAK